MKKKILVVGPSWVGDMVMAQTLFKLLNQQSDVLIDVLAPEWSRPLLARAPEVRKSITMPIGHGQFNFMHRYVLGKQLQNEHYDQAIVLPNSWKSALIPFFANIPLRTGFRGEFRYGLLNDIHYLNKNQLPLMIQRFARLAFPKNIALRTELPYPSLKIDATQVKEALQKHALQVRRPILALCPGAEYGPAKCWPSKYFADVANNKLNEGWDVWLFGSSKDVTIAREIQEATSQRCIDLTGKTSLAEAIDLLSLAKAVVTNDSGLMHIAAALAKPLIVVYGSSDPRFTPPLFDKASILSLHLPCSHCFFKSRIMLISSA